LLEASLQLDQAVRREQTHPHQHVAEGCLGVGPDRGRPHHRTLEKAHLDLLRAGLDLQDPGLALQTDQLKDLADPEVTEVSTQRDRHAYDLSQSAIVTATTAA
jgi:hypothetical protein